MLEGSVGSEDRRESEIGAEDEEEDAEEEEEALED